ncbi:MAG: hypothetical protein JXQ90_07665 [Cyclobacteriaceae bacterium]
MRLLVLTLLVTTTLSCGEVGIALNVSKEFAVSTTFSYDADTTSVNLKTEIPYSLDDVGEFSEYLPKIEETGSVVFNKMSFQVDSVSEREASIILDEFSVKIIHETDTIVILQQKAQLLKNIEKSTLDFTSQDFNKLAEWLTERESISAEVIFYLNAIPEDLDEVSFKFTAFFDATLKARNLKL